MKYKQELITAERGNDKCTAVKGPLSQFLYSKTLMLVSTVRPIDVNNKISKKHILIYN